uniref:Acyl_transf_3 domain-containing protein n=1 Tax=Macrostomum lignano TaxID=282301 RepID=A0A1I8JQV3_9PLAT
MIGNTAAFNASGHPSHHAELAAHRPGSLRCPSAHYAGWQEVQRRPTGWTPRSASKQLCGGFAYFAYLTHFTYLLPTLPTDYFTYLAYFAY